MLDVITHGRGCLSQSLSLLTASRPERCDLATRSPQLLIDRNMDTTYDRSPVPYMYTELVQGLPVKRCRQG